MLLPAYLLGLGFAQLAVGLISSATLIGSALATIWSDCSATASRNAAC